MVLDYVTGYGRSELCHIPDSVLVHTMGTSETVGQLKRDWPERPARGRVVNKLSQSFTCEDFCTSPSFSIPLLTVISSLAHGPMLRSVMLPFFSIHHESWGAEPHVVLCSCAWKSSAQYLDDYFGHGGRRGVVV